MSLIQGKEYVHLSGGGVPFVLLEDKLYYTLMDIYTNAVNYTQCLTSSYYMRLMTNGISISQRETDFTYEPVLDNKVFVRNVCHFLKSYTKQNMFRFAEEDAPPLDMHAYMPYPEWWEQVQELCKQLEELY